MLMGFHIKHFSGKEIEDVAHGIIIDHQRTEHGRLKLDRLGGHLARGAQSGFNAIIRQRFCRSAFCNWLVFHKLKLREFL